MAPTLPSADGLRIQPVEHLAAQLRVLPDRLIDCAKNAENLYREFDRDVRGKKRHLTMALPPLASIQRRILNRVLCRLPVSPHAFGAIKGRSIKGNAKRHAKAPFVAKLDIRAFYPSIKSQRIYDFFRAQKCSPDVASILTHLTTRDHSLPLGTSTSPFLADQIVHSLDHRIGGLARSMGLTYTRYVDDMTISGGFDLARIADKIIEFVHQLGFKIKRSKLEFYRPGDGKKRIITGVEVREGKVFAPATYVEQLGRELSEAREASQHEIVEGQFQTREQYFGRIGYVRWLDQKAGNSLLKTYRKVKWKHLEYAMAMRTLQSNLSPSGSS